MNTQELISNNPKLQDLMDLIRDGRIKPISETAYLYIFKFSEVCPISCSCASCSGSAEPATMIG